MPFPIRTLLLGEFLLGFAFGTIPYEDLDPAWLVIPHKESMISFSYSGGKVPLALIRNTLEQEAARGRAALLCTYTLRHCPRPRPPRAQRGGGT